METPSFGMAFNETRPWFTLAPAHDFMALPDDMRQEPENYPFSAIVSVQFSVPNLLCLSLNDR
jgi:hypothetical protein